MSIRQRIENIIGQKTNEPHALISKQDIAARLKALSEASKSEDHNGWHAYRHLVSLCLGMNGNVPLEWYSNPNFPMPIDEKTWTRRTQSLVDTITDVYKIDLTEEDRDWILTKMKSPNQFVVELAKRLNPERYPNLKSDFPYFDS